MLPIVLEGDTASTATLGAGSMKQPQAEAEEKNPEATAKASEATAPGSTESGAGRSLNDDAFSATPQNKEATPGAPQHNSDSTTPSTQPGGSSEDGVVAGDEEEKKLPPPSKEKADRKGGEREGEAQQQQQQQHGEGGVVSWMYLDGINPIQHGPVAEGVMLKLLRAGTAHKDMMAWSQGMKEWQPLGQVREREGAPSLISHREANFPEIFE